MRSPSAATVIRPFRPPRALRRSPAALLVLLIAGCGGGGDSADTGGSEAASSGSASQPMEAAAGAGSGGTAGGEWSEAYPSFTRHEIARFDSGYYGTAFDVNGDGLRDVVALSTGTSALAWFENPGWERHEITSGTERFIHMAPYDIDGDGDLDLAVASEFSLGDSESGGAIHWAEAPDDPAGTSEWPLHRIDAIPTSHRLRWGDIDGDGTAELLNLPIIGIGASAPEYAGAAQFTVYQIPDPPTGEWPSTVLDDSLLEVAHGFDVVDWDGDDTADLLTASSVGVTLFRPGLDGGPERIGSGHEGTAPNRGSSEVGMGTIGGERFVATVDPWHGTDVVVYTPPDEGPAAGYDEGGALWDRRVIDTTLEGGHGIAVADLDGDGWDEIVAGGRGGDRLLIAFRYRPDTETWERLPLDEGGTAVSSVEVHDIDGDGDLDVLAVGSGTDNVVWYENTGAP